MVQANINELIQPCWLFPRQNPNFLYFTQFLSPCKQKKNLLLLSIKDIYSRFHGVLLLTLLNSPHSFNLFAKSAHFLECDTPVVELRSFPNSFHLLLKNVHLKFVLYLYESLRASQIIKRNSPQKV